jgi:WD40 repeat protein
VAAIDPSSGSVRRETVLDSEEIAATKELVTLRVDAPRKRLVAANGTDESVSILSLPDLEVLREITLEGEVVRDAIPDPAGRFLYILGRTVRVWDAEGRREIATIGSPEAMAIAVSSSGKLLAVVGSEQFESGRATVVALYDPATLKEIAREPLQTDRTIQSAVFAGGDEVLVVAASDWIAEKPVVARGEKKMNAMAPRVTFAFGDLVSSETICLASNSGPQILAVGRAMTRVHFIERRCGESGAFLGSSRKVTTSSILGAKAWATAWDAKTNGLWATDPEGFLTLYRLPAD